MRVQRPDVLGLPVPHCTMNFFLRLRERSRALEAFEHEVDGWSGLFQPVIG
jgi:hypothetical protein